MQTLCVPAQVVALVAGTAQRLAGKVAIVTGQFLHSPVSETEPVLQAEARLAELAQFARASGDQRAYPCSRPRITGLNVAWLLPACKGLGAANKKAHAACIIGAHAEGRRCIAPYRRWQGHRGGVRELPGARGLQDRCGGHR